MIKTDTSFIEKMIANWGADFDSHEVFVLMQFRNGYDVAYQAILVYPDARLDTKVSWGRLPSPFQLLSEKRDMSAAHAEELVYWHKGNGFKTIESTLSKVIMVRTGEEAAQREYEQRPKPMKPGNIFRY